ncbi:hypothetical protein K457DRAFT_30435 [Linnemannia elongata AG-77]|uniref:Uncharacterized protein n=1 Tax=Linnemannia elongata AG-77 TaxID=1314771 RepID=A0A197K4A8_9FUNG|nr:hypothetical protein K457DRAFT_30435 [Linnemannia elongata AG-77]
MDSASTLLFGIPELSALVASSLDYHDLSRLMHIDVRVRLRGCRRYSIADFEALVQNTQLVRGIRMDDTFFDFYYECLAANATVEETRVDDEASFGGVREGLRAEGTREVASGGPGGEGTGMDDACIPTSVTLAASTTSAFGLADVVFSNLTRFEYNLLAPGANWVDWTPVRDTDSDGLVFGKFSLMMPPP